MTEQEIKLQCLELAVDIASQSEESIDINEVLDDAESLFDFVNSKTDNQKDKKSQDYKDYCFNKLMGKIDKVHTSVWDDEVIKDSENTESKAVLTMQLIQDKSHKFKMRLVSNKPLCELDVEITPSGYLKYNGKVADTISAFIDTRK